MTSIAAAWVNIVYGFGGLRSDGNIIQLSPYCPESWKSYQFHLQLFGSNIQVLVEKNEITLTLDKDLAEPIEIYHEIYKLKKGILKIHVAH